MIPSPMSEEFHEWLDGCPVQWHRVRVDNDCVTYTFIKEEDEED